MMLNAWVYLIAGGLGWVFGWWACDVNYHLQKEGVRAKHKAALDEKDAEIKRLRTQVAALIGRKDRLTATEVAQARTVAYPTTCCGDASHGCQATPDVKATDPLRYQSNRWK